MKLNFYNPIKCKSINLNLCSKDVQENKHTKTSKRLKKREREKARTRKMQDFKIRRFLFKNECT